MAFVHHHPRQHGRGRQEHVDDSPSASYATAQHRQERQVPQDWSIVFPGRSRETPASPTIQTTLSSPRSTQIQPQSATTSSDQSDPTGALALTLPPLHDGTGRFLTSSLSPASTDVASIDAALQYSADEDRQSEGAFPESVFSGTDSQLDADEELAFGSGSDFDFDSDAVASSHPSRSSARRATIRGHSHSRSRHSKLSHVSNASDDEDAHASSSHLLGSKAWSLLGRPNGLESVLEVPSTSASTQLYSSAHSSRHLGRTRRSAHQLPVVLTSGSERDDDYDLQHSRVTHRNNAAHADDADLAISNHAASAGLSHLDQSDLLRRPKRRHRRSAAGRSSKRSNTSQSLLSIDYDTRLVNVRADQQARQQLDGAETPRSSTQASRMIQENPSKTTRVIGTILKKVFDLEPEVLDAFLHEDAERQRSTSTQAQSASATRPEFGFSFERGEAPLACAPLSEAAAGMMLDGRSEHERSPASAQSTAVHHLDPATSPLFSNDKPVEGEESTNAPSLRLTEAALLQRGSASTRPTASHALMEPTTMEAFSAFINTMVMPVPMPFRLLGALLGWGSIWNHGSSGKQRDDNDAEDETASREAEEERRYRYERLLSAQQAKAWSRRYRGILFANVDDEEPSPDVPELWRGDEHPAIAGHSDSSYSS